MTDLTTTQTKIAAALETFAADALDLDYLTLAELVTAATGLPCDTADLCAIADAGRFPPMGNAVLLAGYTTAGTGATPALAQIEGVYTAVYTLVHVARETAPAAPKPRFRVPAAGNAW